MAKTEMKKITNEIEPFIWLGAGVGFMIGYFVSSNTDILLFSLTSLIMSRIAKSDKNKDNDKEQNKTRDA